MTMYDSFSAIQTFSAELGLLVLILFLLVLDILYKKEKLIGTLAIGGLGLVLILQIASWGHFGKFFRETYWADPFAYFFKAFFLINALIISLMAREFRHRLERGQNEFFILILLATLGMTMLASGTDFLLLFVALELVTISFYIMTTYLRTDAKSIEAGLKYLVLGALSSGFLLYGISFLYGITGSTTFSKMAQHIAENPSLAKGAALSLVLVLVGIGFKIASVPFQWWVPDVYEGSPTPITAFLSVGSKAAGFLILIRVLFHGFPNFEGEWMFTLSVLSALSLIYGNLGAIPQKNIKRFLGYSSIGHAGYLLMGMAAGSSLGLGGVLYYLSGYLFTNLGAFLIIVIFSNAAQSDEIRDYAGLSQRSPFLAAAMLVALMSLAGIPPLVGFFSKFLVIGAAVQSGLIWLAVLGVFNVIVSLYYYLVIVKKMYLHAPEATTPIRVSLPMRIGIWVCLIGILGLGIFQEPLFKLASMAVKDLF